MSKILSELKRTEMNQFQEELAKTYFSGASSEQKYPPQPNPSIKNNKKTNGLLFIIFSFLLIVTAVIFLIFNRLSISVKITPAFTSGSDYRRYAEMIPFNKSGGLNNELIKNAVFYENAGNESSWGKEVIVLSNEDISKKAVLGIDLIKPINLNGRSLYFIMRGQNGGEEFRIALVDDKSNVCYSKTDKITNDWQAFVVDETAMKNFIDTERITHIDFEVNPAEKGFSNNSVIYFKNVYLVKQEGGLEK